MSRRAATIAQADIARVIRAAKQAGASEVELKLGGQTVTIRLQQSTAIPRPDGASLAAEEEYIL